MQEMIEAVKYCRERNVDKHLAAMAGFLYDSQNENPVSRLMLWQYLLVRDYFRDTIGPFRITNPDGSSMSFLQWAEHWIFAG